jgi:methyltransferase (TIGR00027 family)
MIQAQPSRTALRVALRRAAHQLVDARPLVFPDPFAVAIVGTEAAEELRRTPKAERKPYSAAMRSWMVARARFAEDVLAHAVQATGATQYLVLGAGLDTFALRNPYPQVRVFEVDHPATQGWKRERLQIAGLQLPQSAQLVPVDFETQSLRQQLVHAGFNLAQPTVTAWLGVVPYLTAEAFAATCRVLGRCAQGSAVVFDYGLPREALPAVEQLMLDSLMARVAQAGEPFQLFFTPQALTGELERFGLAVADDLGSPELNARYFAGRSDGLGLRGTGGRVCCAVVP